MTRTLDSATQTASEAGTIYPVWFVKLQFDSGTLHLHTAHGDITWGGDTYLGVGAIGSISPVDEDSELARSTLQMSLRGLPTDIVSIALNEQPQGRRATVYLGYLDPATHQLVADPGVLYRGSMDTCSIKQDKELVVTLSVESRFAAWDRPLVRRYNDADQRARYPGDTGLQFVEQAVEKQIYWGQRAPA